MTLHRGKIARTPVIGLIRPLTKDDLALLRPGRDPASSVGVIAKLRDPHHRIARLFAAGLRTDEVVARSGFSYSRVLALANTPAFKELIAKYREKVDASFIATMDDYHEIATSNMLKAEVQISERLETAEEEGTQLPIRDLLAISRDAADRFGYGKRNMNVNVNVDFAAQLEKTIARTKSTVIDAVAAPLQPQPPMGEVRVPASPPPPSAHPTLPLIRRRA